MFHKCRFTFSDGGFDEIYDGYTDDTLWNGWANVFMSKEQIKDFLDCLPYDYKFYSKEDENKGSSVPCLVIFGLGNGDEEIVESSTIWDGKEFIESYSLEGYEFVVVE